MSAAAAIFNSLATILIRSVAAAIDVLFNVAVYPTLTANYRRPLGTPKTQVNSVIAPAPAAPTRSTASTLGGGRVSLSLSFVATKLQHWRRFAATVSRKLPPACGRMLPLSTLPALFPCSPLATSRFAC